MIRLFPVAVISLLVCALVVGVRAAPAQTPMPDERQEQAAAPGVASGGHYRLQAMLQTESNPAEAHALEPAVAVGGRYRLMSVLSGNSQSTGSRVGGEASGGHYRLLSTGTPGAQGSGCCCTFLPCVPRNQ